MAELPVHGYDDAVAGKTKLYEASARWFPFLREEIQEIAYKGMTQHYIRMRALAGLPSDFMPKKVDTAAKKIHVGMREIIRAAPLVYVSPGIVANRQKQSHTVPDIHVLPFAEPMILWLSHAVSLEFEPGYTPEEDLRVPSRAMLVVPDVEDERIFYQSFFDTKELLNAAMKLGLEPSNFTHKQFVNAGYFMDIIGTVSCGSTPGDEHTSAQLVAQMLNSMASRDSRMVEEETEVKQTRKEAKRAGIENPGDVHVIYLPRERKVGSKYVPTDTNPDGTPRRRHRVRAHWRRQPYGPRGAGQWRWKRIESFERGHGAFISDNAVYTAPNREATDA